MHEKRLSIFLQKTAKEIKSNQRENLKNKTFEKSSPIENSSYFMKDFVI